MATDRFSDVVAELDAFEPGSPAEQLALALVGAAIGVARALEALQWNPAGSGYTSIEELRRELAATNEKLDNFVRVLSSATRDDD